jgi:hypothetical protein
VEADGEKGKTKRSPPQKRGGAREGRRGSSRDEFVSDVRRLEEEDEVCVHDLDPFAPPAGRSNALSPYAMPPVREGAGGAPPIIRVPADSSRPYDLPRQSAAQPLHPPLHSMEEHMLMNEDNEPG